MNLHGIFANIVGWIHVAFSTVWDLVILLNWLTFKCREHILPYYLNVGLGTTIALSRVNNHTSRQTDTILKVTNPKIRSSQVPPTVFPCHTLVEKPVEKVC